MATSTNKEIIGKATAVAGDILCAKADGSKMVVKTKSDVPSGWTAIGIVVIPPSHNVYGTGEGAAVSLCLMAKDSPNSGWSGSGYGNEIRYGHASNLSGATNYTQVNVYQSKNNLVIGANPTLSIAEYPCPAANAWVNTNGTYSGGYYDSPDGVSGYLKAVSFPMPSPYTSSGSRNSEYYTKQYTSSNAMSDFSGKSHTKRMCDNAAAQSDWKTASTIADGSSAGYYPAACCCWRYRTTGTNQGDWYLPSIGELGYLIARFGTIDRISTHTFLNNRDNLLMSSTTYSDVNFVAYSFKSGELSARAKQNMYYYVRAFIRF